MLMTKIFSAIFFVLFFTAVMSTEVLAAEIKLPTTSINPDKYLFFSIKRLIEKATLLTKLNKESKVTYYKGLTLTRMAELKYVVENNLLGEVERSTQRLSYQVGILSDYITVDNKELSNKKQDIKNLLIGFKKPLENLRDKYPANSSYWMLVQHSINSIDLNLEKLK